MPPASINDHAASTSALYFPTAIALKMHSAGLEPARSPFHFQMSRHASRRFTNYVGFRTPSGAHRTTAGAALWGVIWARRNRLPGRVVPAQQAIAARFITTG